MAWNEKLKTSGTWISSLHVGVYWKKKHKLDFFVSCSWFTMLCIVNNALSRTSIIYQPGKKEKVIHPPYLWIWSPLWRHKTVSYEFVDLALLLYWNVKEILSNYKLLWAKKSKLNVIRFHGVDHQNVQNFAPVLLSF